MKLYHYYKPIVLQVEETSHAAFMPAITNLRDSYDHLIRVFSVKMGFKEADRDSIDDNLRSAYSHLYRALYDTLDYWGIILKERIIDLLDDMPAESITAVIPEYYREVRPFCNDVEKLFAKFRDDMNIGSINFDDIDEYIECVNKLEEHVNLIERNLSAMQEHRIKIWWKDLRWVWVTIAATAIGTIIGIFVGAVL